MNKLFKIASAAILAGSFVLPIYSSARAQEYKVKPLERAHEPRGGLRNQDAFFDSHPDVYQQLQGNPRLVDNPEYMKNHPELREYMHTHPNIREAWRQHPREAMHREERWQEKHPNQ